MYVAITGKGKSRVVQFCEQHRIAKTNKKKTIVVKTIGNYEALLRENPNIILELKKEAKRLTDERKKNTSKNILFRFGHSFVYSLWVLFQLLMAKAKMAISVHFARLVLTAQSTL